jgi:hypothetical protein
MSQGAITAGRLAASVRPGRAADGYGHLIAARAAGNAPVT